MCLFLSVKFIIMPEGHVQSMTCSLKQSFSELRNHFSSEFNQPPQVILMIFDGTYGSLVIWDLGLLLCSSKLNTELKIKFINERFHFFVSSLKSSYEELRIILYCKWDLLYKTSSFWIRLTLYPQRWMAVFSKMVNKDTLPVLSILPFDSHWSAYLRIGISSYEGGSHFERNNALKCKNELLQKCISFLWY